jgi:hypothetical protein
MSNRTIAKFAGLVILLSCALAVTQSCSHAARDDRYSVVAADFSSEFEKPVTTGHIESKDVIESSGLASSPCQENVLWTHNDSGDDAYIFAMTPNGKHLGTWRVTNARNDDWEDMAAYKDPDGNCYLYIGDIGNNKADRALQKIYRIKEPAIPADGANSDKKNPLISEAATVSLFKYPDSPHNAETMMVHQQSGDVYVLTKRVDGPSLVFKIRPVFGSTEVVMAQKVGEVSVPAVPNGLLTGGAISPDGKSVIVCDYSAGYELRLGEAVDFDQIWMQKPVPVDLGDRKQGETVTFSRDGRSVIATSEKRNSPIIQMTRK